MGIIYNTLKSHHGKFDMGEFSTNLQSSFTVADKFNNSIKMAIGAAVYGNDQALFDSISACLKQDVESFCADYKHWLVSAFETYVEQKNISRHSDIYRSLSIGVHSSLALGESTYDSSLGNYVLKLLKDNLSLSVISFSNDEEDYEFSLDDEQFKKLSEALGISAYTGAMLTIISGEYDITDLHHSLYSVNKMSNDDLIDFITLGISFHDTADHKNVFYIHTNIPDKIAINPVINGIRLMQLDGLDDTPYSYDVRRLNLTKKHFGKNAQIALALENFIIPEFNDLALSLTEMSNDEDFEILRQWAKSFNDSMINDDNEISFDLYEGQLEATLKFPLDVFRKYKKRIGDDYLITTKERTTHLLSQIKTRRAAFNELDRRIGLANKENNAPADKLALYNNAIGLISHYAGDDKMKSQIACMTDDLSMPELCRLTQAVLVNAERDEEAESRILKDIGTHYPFASWLYMVNEELLSYRQLETVFKNFRYQSMIPTANFSSEIEALCDLAEACEVHYPGLSKYIISLVTPLNPDDYLREVTTRLNRVKGQSLERVESASADLGFLDSYQRI